MQECVNGVGIFVHFAKMHQECMDGDPRSTLSLQIKKNLQISLDICSESNTSVYDLINILHLTHSIVNLINILILRMASSISLTSFILMLQFLLVFQILHVVDDATYINFKPIWLHRFLFRNMDLHLHSPLSAYYGSQIWYFFISFDVPNLGLVFNSSSDLVIIH